MARFIGRNFTTGLVIGCIIAIGVAIAAYAYERYDTKTLNRTVRRDAVYCGVNTGLPGFSAQDDKGNWSGFDVDFCRAIAAAIFDDPKKVKFVPLDAKERFDELGKRKVDVLARNSTWTFQRDTDLKMDFAGVNYYDGQGFMVRKDLGVSSAKELDGATICIQTGTSTELNLADWFRANNMTYQPVNIDSNAEGEQQYMAAPATPTPPTPRAWPASACGSPTPRTTSSCRRSSPRSRSARPCATATTSGSTSSNGRTSPCSTPRNSASPRPMSTTWRSPTIRTSSGCSAPKASSAKGWA